MLWRSLEKLGTASISEVLKVGDTAADMHEAKNAGCLCAGVIAGSSMLGLSQAEYAALGGAEKAALFGEAARRYRREGADYVIDDISALPELVGI